MLVRFVGLSILSLSSYGLSVSWLKHEVAHWIYDQMSITAYNEILCRVLAAFCMP